MKAALLLSTLAVGLIAPTSSVARAVNMWPSRPYDAHGYFQESGTPGPVWTDHKGRIGRRGRTEHRKARVQHRASLEAIDSRSEIPVGNRLGAAGCGNAACEAEQA
jgi:hypothetical protein